jgi:exopolysaccharide production protein ExoZ
MAVVMHHIILQLSTRGFNWSFEQGAAGVDVFFVISGFVIYIAGRKLNWREFAGRRIARIVPLYWLFLIIKLIFSFAVGHNATRPIGSVNYIISSFLFIPAYRGDSADPTPLITSAWTLNYEMYFYAACTLVLLLIPRQFFVISITFLIGITSLLGIAIFSQYAAVQLPAVFSLLNPICFEFLAGIGLGVLWVRGTIWPTAVAITLLTLSAIWFFVAPKSGLLQLERSIIWGIPAVMLVWSGLMFERHISFSKLRTLLLLGDASYALYLSHSAVLPLIDKINSHFNIPWLAQILILAASCIFVGIVVHIFIERPITAWMSQLLRLHARSPMTKSV